MEGGLTARILVIEDNPTNLQLVMYLLQAFGHEVKGSKDGPEGIEMACNHGHDLILLDIHMPKMDGYEVARRLRDDPRCRHIPIVAVTALAMVGDREKLLNSGFEGYISKPIDPETFPAKVQEYLDQPGPRPPQTIAVSASAICRTANHVPPRGLLLFVDNSPVNLQLARSILEPQGYEVLTAPSVEEGVKVARSRRPNLIVSDIHMPRQDGYYFADLLRTDTELRHIPFLFLSSSLASSGDDEQARTHGALKVLHRPIDPETLLGELEACLKPN